MSSDVFVLIGFFDMFFSQSFLLTKVVSQYFLRISGKKNIFPKDSLLALIFFWADSE